MKNRDYSSLYTNLKKWLAPFRFAHVAATEAATSLYYDNVATKLTFRPYSSYRSYV